MAAFYVEPVGIIGSSSRLLEETLQMLSTECPSSQGENTFGFSVWCGEPLFDGACRYRWRSRPAIMNPVYKAKPKLASARMEPVPIL